MRNKEGIEAIQNLFVSAANFAGMATTARLDKGVIASIAQEAGLQGEGKGFHFPKLLNAVCAYLRKKADDAASDITNDKARRVKAEADNAELKAITRKEYLAEIGDEVWMDRAVAYRAMVERADYLTPEQKSKLLKDTAAIRFEVEEDEEDEDFEPEDDPAFL